MILRRPAVLLLFIILSLLPVIIMIGCGGGSGNSASANNGNPNPAPGTPPPGGTGSTTSTGGGTGSGSGTTTGTGGTTTGGGTTSGGTGTGGGTGSTTGGTGTGSGGGTTGSGNPASPAQFIYLGRSAVEAFKIDQSTGLAARVAGSPFNWSDGFVKDVPVAADPKGRFVYQASTLDFPHGNKIGKNQIVEFKVDRSTGSLSLIAENSVTLANQDSGIGGLLINPSGTLMYVSMGSSLLLFAIDASSGALSLRATLPWEGGMMGAISPNGKYLVGVIGLVESITIYPLGADGVPGPASGSVATHSYFPNMTVIDPTNRYILMALAGDDLSPSHGVGVVRINDDGTPSIVAGSPYKMVTDPTSITVTPSGQFVYVNAKFGSEIWAFRVEPTTGALIQVPGSPYTFGGAQAASGVVTDGTGGFLFVGDFGNTPAVLTYKIDPITGALSLVPGSPVPQNGSTFALGAMYAVP